MRRILKTTVEYAQKKPWKTAEEMEECCCGDCMTDPCEMVRCEETASPWFGYTYEELIEKTGIIVDENGFDQSGRRVILRPVNHRPGRCGDNITKMGNCHSCCDEVTPIEWDADKSASVINPDSSALVFVTGGIAPYSWQVRKDGISFDQAGRVRNIDTDSPWTTIYADEDVCGSFSVDVTDGCSTAAGTLRCTLGVWEKQWRWCRGSGVGCDYVWDDYPPEFCPIDSGEETVYDVVEASYTVDTVKDDKKLTEHITPVELDKGGSIWGDIPGHCEGHCENNNYEPKRVKPCSGDFESGLPCYGGDPNCSLEDPPSDCGGHCYDCGDNMSYMYIPGGGGPWHCMAPTVTVRTYYEWVC